MPIVVCVPARNEAASLPSLLSALAGLEAGAAPLHVCIFLDGCEDDSAAVLAHAHGALPFRLWVESGRGAAPPNAGLARRAAMAMADAVLGPHDGLLFSTDADSCPRPDWIMAGTRALVEADVAAGRIVRRDAGADPEQSRIERYYDRLYHYRRTIDPVPWEAADAHHFSGGANLAMRASAYRALGGFVPLAVGEDARLLDDAARAGLRVRRDGAMIVETSSRRSGRAPGGLAGALRALDGGEVPHVAHPDAAAWQWRWQAAARGAFASIGQVDVRTSLGAGLGLTGDHVLGVARDCPNAEAFAMRVVPAPAGRERLVPLSVAEDALAALELGCCGLAA